MQSCSFFPPTPPASPPPSLKPVLSAPCGWTRCWCSDYNTSCNICDYPPNFSPHLYLPYSIYSLPFHSHSLSSPFETPQLLFILPNPLISNICKYIPSSPFSPFDFFIQINSFPTFMESVKLSCYSITFSDKDKIFFWILYASLSVPTQMLFYFLMKNARSLIGWCID